ncbi:MULTISPECIES: HAMP domain-containing sensor histidine kinase [unclassified Actinoplanes]|uniref:HAMP domain-containing sensor histidine kinase n=1 Tax=unclassified Actinoplanes TaxID=2626549 RepID=UPI0002FF5A64|nr:MULTISPECIES: HAMP domain-containing sensor histidine kinase [unclassified Actinoplanes]
MRNRLMSCYSVLLAAVLTGLIVPLAISTVTRDTQAMFIDRLNDTDRLASLADPALRTGHITALSMELRQYHQIYGVDVLLVDRDGVTVLEQGDGQVASRAMLRRYVDEALTGERHDVSGAIWPWRDQPLVVATPIGRGGEIIGGILTISPVRGLQLEVWRYLAVLAACGVLAMIAGIAVGQPLVRWILRPVYDLDAMVTSLPEQLHRSRAAESGPPELQRLAASVNQMADRITELIDRQGSFVSYAGHQLRTPLASLRIALDNLAPAPGKRDRSHEIAVQEADRSAAIIDSLLAYASANARAAAATEIDAVPAIEAWVAARQPMAEAARVQLVCRAAGPRWVRVAPSVLDQAVEVLVDNAVKYGETRTRIFIEVAAPEPGWVEVSVEDDGVGIPDDELLHAVEPFWRHPSRQVHDGSGLGLSIIGALVTASGGELQLAGVRPHGLRATVRLPAARTECDAR